MNLATEVALVRVNIPVEVVDAPKGAGREDELQTVVKQLLRVPPHFLDHDALNHLPDRAHEHHSS